MKKIFAYIAIILLILSILLAVKIKGIQEFENDEIPFIENIIHEDSIIHLKIKDEFVIDSTQVTKKPKLIDKETKHPSNDIITSNPTNNHEVFKDNRDNKYYRTIKIGNQIWMADNLEVVFSNGTSFYRDYKKNIRGHLYTYEVAKKACPENQGWFLPTKKDWLILSDYLGGNTRSGGKLKEKGNKYWKGPNIGATNSSGSNARPGGRLYSNSLVGINEGFWWTSSEYGSDSVSVIQLSSNYEEMKIYNNSKKNLSLNIRCIKSAKKIH